MERDCSALARNIGIRNLRTGQNYFLYHPSSLLYYYYEYLKRTIVIIYNSPLLSQSSEPLEKGHCSGRSLTCTSLVSSICVLSPPTHTALVSHRYIIPSLTNASLVTRLL